MFTANEPILTHVASAMPYGGNHASATLERTNLPQPPRSRHTNPDVRRLGQAWPELIRPLQFAVEDVPPSDPTPWQTEPNMTSQCFPASHGIPARVVLYRMPLQTEAPTKLELQLAVRDELVARIAELYGRRPEEIDPDWGL
mgnify:CR=1 FL=1